LQERGEDYERGIQTMGETLKLELQRRFIDLGTNMLYTYLDPRYKSKFFSEALKGQTQHDYAALCESMSTSDGTVTTIPKKKAALQPCSSKSIEDSMAEFLNSTEQEGNEVNPNSAYNNMVQEYHKEKKLEPNGDPLLWWKMNKNKYGVLCKLARQFLSPPASSVPSEQLFSGAGLIYDPLRN